MNRKVVNYFIILNLIFTCIICVASHLWNHMVKNQQSTLRGHTAMTEPKTPTIQANKSPQDTSLPTPEQTLDKYNASVSAFDTDVRFWGRVLDQNQIPIEGATIKATVTTLRMIKAENDNREYSVISTRSAADGLFELNDAKGFSLTIRELSKDGFVLPSAYQSGTRWDGAKYFYCYKSFDGLQSVFRPDLSQPVVFHLWKLKKPEPVTIIEAHGASPKFKVGAPPAPEVFTNMNISDIGTAQVPQWEVTVSGIKSDDGVIKADPSDLFMFLAPASGYTHSIKFSYGMKGTDAIMGEDGAPVRFYVRSKGGRWYSAEECAFFAPNGDGTIIPKIRSWTNPNGSRNLEHDAAHPLPEPLLNE